MEYPTYIAIYKFLSEGMYPLDCDDPVVRKRIRNQARRYVALDGRLFRRRQDSQPGPEVLHSRNVDEVISQVHSEGHFGINNTWRRLRLQYDGHQMFEKVREFVQQCDTCQKRARRSKLRKEEAHPIPTPSRPFYMVGCDAVGPVLPSKRGNRYILVAIDYLTRWPVAAAVPDITEETTSRFLFECIVKDFGVPSYLLTDRGSNFLADHVEHFLRTIGCRHLATTAYRPQVNGLCERMNQTLVQALSKIVRDRGEKSDWDDSLAAAVLAVRTMPNEATRFSPSMLLYGYEMRTPATWPAPRRDYIEGRLEEEVLSRIRVITGIEEEQRVLAKARTAERQAQRKQRYDVAVYPERHEVGEEVLLLDPAKTTKFSDTWLGPYTVVKVNHNGTYWLAGPRGRRLDGAVNGDRLRRYQSRGTLVPAVGRGRWSDDTRSWIEPRRIAR